MNAFLFGVGGVILFISVLLLLPILLNGKKAVVAVVDAAEEEKWKPSGIVVRLGLAAVAVVIIFFYDWETTALGKRLLEGLTKLGFEDLFSTIVWGTMLSIGAILLFLSWGKKEGKGGSSSINLTGILMAAVMTATAVGIYGFVDLKKDERKYEQLPIKVDLTKLRYGRDGEPGESKELLMRLNNIATVQLRPVHVNEPGEGYLWACPEIADASLYDKVVMFQVVGGGGTNQNLIAIAPDSESYLYSKYGLINVRVKFTLMRAWDKPCPYLLTK